MYFIFHSLFALASITVVTAFPQNLTTQHSSSRIATPVPEYVQRFLDQLPESEQPVLARNALPYSDLPIINLPYGRYRATKYVKENDVQSYHILSHCIGDGAQES
jgi:hypothetical protein